MKFEEALAALRAGKKIRHPNFEKDVYLEACWLCIAQLDEDSDTKIISIAKMKGDRLHPEMYGALYYISEIKKQLKKILTEDEYKKYHNIYFEQTIAEAFDNDIFYYPQLNLQLIMDEDWEIYESETNE